MSYHSIRGVLSCLLLVGIFALPGRPSPDTGSPFVDCTPLEAISSSTLVDMSDGARLRTFDIAPELPTALVFVHGDAVSADFWLPQVEHFRGRFRMVLYDRAECGASSVGRQPLTYSRSARELGELLTRLDVRDFILVGHSRGQEIAATYFASRPRGLRALIACGTVLQPTPSQESKAQARDLFKRRVALVDRACEEIATHRDWLRAAMHLSEAEARELTSFWCTHWRPQEDILAGIDVDIASALSEIEIPMLQIDGGAYRKGVDRREAMQRWYRNGRLVLIDGAEHVPSLSHVEEFNRVMDEFLQGLKW